MNFQQLEYIVAVAEHRHFARAAEACHVTQPTLSTMIQKLEEELGTLLFDRSKQPVVATETGERLIAQARLILKEGKQMKVIAESGHMEISGELHLGIIPTLAPYLLPRFLNAFLEKYPRVHLKITELTTELIAEMLKKDQLDAALMATPLHFNGLREQPLFYEKFLVYVSNHEELYKKNFALAEDIDINRLWLLEEGHCMRLQVLNLCELRKKQDHKQFEYASGSIETLIRMVETQGGVTILPELALDTLSGQQLKRVRHFDIREPHREISIVTYRQLKTPLLDALVKEIQEAIPDNMKKHPGEKAVEIWKKTRNV